MMSPVTRPTRAASTPHRLPPPSEAPPAPPISRRIYVLAALLVPANAWWLRASLQQGAAPGLLTVFGHLVLMLFALTLLNRHAPALRRLWRVVGRGSRLALHEGETSAPRPLLTRAEMLFLYVILGLTTSLMGGYDFLPSLVQVMHTPFSQPGAPDWTRTVWPFVPEWLTVRDPRALDFRAVEKVGLYHVEWQRVEVGAVSLAVPSWPIVQPWIVPVLAWSAFMTAMLFTSLCLVELVRHRWTEDERLSYPLVRLPLMMTEPGAPLLRKPAFWYGFGVAAGVDLLNGLHGLLPFIPEVPIRVEIPEVYGSSPLKTGLFPCVVGLAFFMPLEMLVSVWLFAAFGMWQRSLAYGVDAATWYGPYLMPSGQLFGRYMAVAVFALWPLLRSFRAQAELARQQPSPHHPGASPSTARRWSFVIGRSTAINGAVLGMLAMLLFCIAGGMQVWAALLFLVIYFVILLTLARLRAEVGPPITDLWHNGPASVLAQAAGPLLERSDLGMLGLFHGFSRNIVAHPLPQQLEAFKIGQEARMPLRPLAVALMAYGAWGILCTFWAQVHFVYAPYGNWSRNFLEHQKQLANWLHNPPWNETFAATQGVGFGSMAGMILLNRHVLGWPLHPIGLLLSGGAWTDRVSMGVFAAWLVKAPVMHYGGAQVYARYLPFFAGLAVGDFAGGSAWTLLGGITRISMYSFFP